MTQSTTLFSAQRLTSVIVLSLLMGPLNAATFEQMLSAAERGDARAQLSVGLSYYFGQYVQDRSPMPLDYEQAVNWLSQSAEAGNGYAGFHLGGMYSAGEGVEKDSTKAAHFYELAAKAGNMSARHNLAQMYFSGDGVVKDFTQAYAWAALAAYQGAENSKALVSRIIPELADREAANRLAESYFQRYGATDEYAN